MEFPDLDRVRASARWRQLRIPDVTAIDFSSNDYLGVARKGIPMTAHALRGGTGSRLISGHSVAIAALEETIATFHRAPAALLFSSGYMANVALVQALVARHDVLLYDAYIHRSVREVARLVNQAFAFRHNDLLDLARKLRRFRTARHRWVYVESLYSMEGDKAPLSALVELCLQHEAHLIVDEAHALGVFGVHGEGLAQEEALLPHIFARVHTFGKALGVCGAAITGSTALRDQLINFAPTFIYTTALPNVIVDGIAWVYQRLPSYKEERAQLRRLSTYFQQLDIPFARSYHEGPLQYISYPGNSAIQALADSLYAQGCFVVPIRSPTVPEGSERLRIVLHAYNTEAELDFLQSALRKF